MEKAIKAGEKHGKVLAVKPYSTHKTDWFLWVILVEVDKGRDHPLRYEHVTWMVNTDGSVHLMTEWALESSRPSGADDLSVGRVGEIYDWDSLYAGRFHAYVALLETYSWRDGMMRKLLHNNVTAGRAVARKVAEVS